MDGRVCLITGGNSGIGEATATALCRLGADVVIVSRDPNRGHEAAARISERCGREVGLIQGDLSSRRSVHELAARVLARLPRLHVLVNNAGLMLNRREESTDGLEMTFAVNHLAPFLLTNLLTERLRQSGAARVVNVASSTYAWFPMDWDDLQATRRFWGMRQYARSKLCNVLFTRALAARLEGTGVTANCLHPGVVNTGIDSRLKGPLKAVFALGMKPLLSPEKGARTSVHLAASPEVAHTSGEYFVRCKPRPLRRRARETEDAERLWSLSAELCGL